jgi:hypothetical protein
MPEPSSTPQHPNILESQNFACPSPSELRNAIHGYSQTDSGVGAYNRTRPLVSYIYNHIRPLRAEPSRYSGTPTYFYRGHNFYSHSLISI